MKLIHYTLRNLLAPLLVIFTLWGCMFCLLILHEVKDETNDTLENYKEIIIRSALADSTLLRDHVDIMSRYYIREVSKDEARLNNDDFYDSTVYIEIEKEYEPVRVLRTYFMAANSRYYELVIELSTLEQEDMIETIIWSVLVLYALLIGCILLVIHQGFRKSFKPLYKLLDWLQHFHVGKTVAPLDNPTPIEEFKTLNEAVLSSSHRSNDQYNRQKQFVENAAHELQTPLAICLNKLELLSENPNNTEEQLKELSGLHLTLLSTIRLNKSLLLLTRIENKQFPDTCEIDMNRLIHQMTDDFNDIYESKALHVTLRERGKLVCTMNESLASTLTANLLKNAYVHNHEGGTIEITTTPKSLVIANTGVAAPLDMEQLSARFARQGGHKESLGLGLAIAKSIADLYSLRIEYQYEDGFHKIMLIFP